jgi:hypothetical protein
MCARRRSKAVSGSISATRETRCASRNQAHLAVVNPAKQGFASYGTAHVHLAPYDVKYFAPHHVPVTFLCE